jgi:hypothetical protein
MIEGKDKDMIKELATKLAKLITKHLG